ncbi:MAG: hypothetical protein HQK99_09765 [Nitrospirae bacterium]|nr:hypothetical protein [Nitrospirota bacterium]
MEIAGVGTAVIVQTNVSAADTQTKQQTYAQPASQQQPQQSAERTATTPNGTNSNDAVKVTITNAGKDMLNNSQLKAKETGGDNTNTLSNLAKGNNTQPGAQAGNDVKNKNQGNTPPPAENSLFSNSAYYSVENNGTDNKQSVVVKIVDANGNVVRSIPPEDLLESASKLNVIPNYLYHAVG